MDEGYKTYPSDASHNDTISILDLRRFPTMDDTPADRLRKARIARGYRHASEAIAAHSFVRATYNANENGNATFSFKKAKEYAKAFRVRPEWLYDGAGPMTDAAQDEPMVRVIGTVGAASDGVVVMETAHDRWDFVPIAPGGTGKASALEVKGGSMPGLAEDGALLYFEEQVTKPGKDMQNRVVIVETMDGRVLVKRLLRGSEKGRFDLESILGPTLEDVEIRWAAHITAIIPPIQAQKIIRRWAEVAA